MPREFLNSWIYDYIYACVCALKYLLWSSKMSFSFHPQTFHYHYANFQSRCNGIKDRLQLEREKNFDGVRWWKNSHLSPLRWRYYWKCFTEIKSVFYNWQIYYKSVILSKISVQHTDNVVWYRILQLPLCKIEK